MSIRMHTLALAALVGAAAPLASQGIGTPLPSSDASVQISLSGATFLELPVGAREAALGGAAAATTNGLTALYWNTAAAADLRHITGTISQNDLYGGSGLRQSYAAIGIPFGGASVAALSFNYFTSGDIVRTTEQFPEGGDPSAGGTVAWNAFAASAHYARRLTERLAVGVTGKYVTEGVDFAKLRWFASDFSTLFRTGIFSTTLGASLTNLGGNSHFEGPALSRNIPQGRDVFPVSRDVQVKLDMQDVPLPLGVQFAVSTEVLGGESALYDRFGPDHALTVNAAFADANDRAIQPLVGVEYRFRELFAARIGKRFYAPSDGPWSAGYGMSGGFGLSFPVMDRRFSFDYAAWYNSTTSLPATQTFTLQFGY